MGYSTREEIIRAFYDVENISVSDERDVKDNLIGKVLADAVMITDPDTNEEKKLYKAGEKLHPHNVDELLLQGITQICVIKFDAESSLDSQMIINCFEREEIRFTKEGASSDEPTKDDALSAVYSVLMPGEPITVDAAEKDLNTMFFSMRRYDLGRVALQT